MDFGEQSTIKNPASSSMVVSVFTELKAIHTSVHLETAMCIPWPTPPHGKLTSEFKRHFFQIKKVECSTSESYKQKLETKVAP